MISEILVNSTKIDNLVCAIYRILCIHTFHFFLIMYSPLNVIAMNVHTA